MTDPRARYIRDHAPTLLLVQASRAEPGAKLDLDAAIRHAAALYDRLTVAGYTADSRPAADTARVAKTRSTVDHRAALSPEQAADFDRFYQVYGVLKGKQRAAARWAELAADAALRQRIIKAAAQDAATPRPADAVRKYPEGWLSERRWEDQPLSGEPASADPAAARAAEVRELLAERRTVAALYQAHPDPALGVQLAGLDASLAALGVTADLRAVAAARSVPAGLTQVAALLGRGVIAAAGTRPAEDHDAA